MPKKPGEEEEEEGDSTVKAEIAQDMAWRRIVVYRPMNSARCYS